MDKKLFVVLILGFMVFGCVSAPTNGAAPNATENITANVTNVTTNLTNVTVPVEKPFKPVRLDYVITMYQGMDQNATPTNVSYTLWFNAKQKCGTRDALTGIGSMEFNSQQKMYFKVTAYLDNGDMVQTGWVDTSSLAFDDMVAAESDLTPVALTLSSAYAQVGKNLITDPVWNSTTPTILKNVESSQSITNFSIMKTGASTTGELPCTIFNLAIKGTDSSGTASVCIANMNEDVPLPFVVSFAFEGQGNAPKWVLKKYSFESPSVVSAPQCLEAVRCKYVPRPTTACTNGTIEQIRDAKNCVTSYTCMPYREKAISSIRSSENPSCSDPSEALISKAISCLTSDSQNIDGARDNSGCLTDITCRR